jgi:uncharacterized membrane protein
MSNILIKINLLLVVSGCLIILITSCVKPYDPQFPVYYNVINNTNSKITVIFNGLVNPRSYDGIDGIQVQDSVIMIEPGNEQSLFVTLYSSYEKTNPETGDTLKGMHTLRIYMNDTILSNKNFLLTKYWEYFESNKKKADLKLIVKTNDFN